MSFVALAQNCLMSFVDPLTGSPRPSRETQGAAPKRPPCGQPNLELHKRSNAWPTGGLVGVPVQYLLEQLCVGASWLPPNALG